MKIFLAVVYLIVMALMFGCSKEPNIYFSHSSFKVDKVNYQGFSETVFELVEVASGTAYYDFVSCSEKYLKFIDFDRIYVLSTLIHDDNTVIYNSDIICKDAKLKYLEKEIIDKQTP